MAAPLPLSIAAGLLIGKQVSIFGMVFLLVKTGVARLPDRASWSHVCGINSFAGIGHTKPLLIGSLSFSDINFMNDRRMGA
ncbi:MAG: Na+/H+ antiporter NhaA [Rhodobacteraceae bacterium]|nr:Na+/H+ antiporter NhaA [Paracoccaceae bacterium]